MPAVRAPRRARIAQILQINLKSRQVRHCADDDRVVEDDVFEAGLEIGRVPPMDIIVLEKYEEC